MTATTKRFSFEEYLKYDDGTNTRYELVNGELVPMAIGSGQHGAIVKFLERTFDAEIARLGREWIALQAAVGVRSPRGNRWDTARIPDVTVISLDQWRSLQNRAAIIDLDEPSPLLVVEVVSESTKSTDYRAKRAEYSVLEIPEYWIVDPLIGKVTVLTLAEGWYDAAEFSTSDRITSPTFPKLELSAEQVFNTIDASGGSF